MEGAGDPHSSCQQLCETSIRVQGTGTGTVPAPALDPQTPPVPTTHLVPPKHPRRCWEGITGSSTAGAHRPGPGSALGAAGRGAVAGSGDALPKKFSS